MKKRGGLLVFLVTLLTIFLAMTGVRMTAKAEDGNYLTFTGTGPFSIMTANYEKNWNGMLEYSTDTNAWTEWNGSLIYSGTDNKLYIRGTGNTVITGNDPIHCWLIISSETVACNGDIRTLLEYSDPSSSTMGPYCFSYMFYGCTQLSEAPELPASSLAEDCYYAMFYGCTSLKSAPELPATSLAEDCYQSMFYGCTSLTMAPQLPATSLAEDCYQSMFYGCTSLTMAPQLPATSLTKQCYSNMFHGCTSLTKAPELSASSLADWCFAFMFGGCTSLKSAPELPVTSLADYCYYAMFYGCTSLTKAPELPATSLAKECYCEMFNGCTNLTIAPQLPATSLAEHCYWGMFCDCTSLTVPPELPATSLTDSCYKHMFNGCTSLRISEKADGIYTSVYRIPTSGNGTTATDSLYCTFDRTGGSFTGTPAINKTYYIPGYSVTLNGGKNATVSSGRIRQIGLESSMAEVTYTADTNYYFSEFTDITKNGVTVKWINDSTVTVSGTPTADTTLQIPDAQKITYTVTYKVINGTWSDGTTNDKTEDVDIGSKPSNIPTGMLASSGYFGGEWDQNPADTTITEATTFTYSFVAKPLATVTKAPTAKSLTFSGSAQELIIAGEALDGTMVYAIGTNATTAPSDDKYTSAIPTATNAGTYYVWYKVAGDESHNDSDAACIKVIISEPDKAPVVETETPAEPLSNVGFNSGLKIVQKKGKIKLSWNKTESMGKCEVYISYCGKDFSNKPTKVTNSSSVTIKKIKGKKIDFTKNMKVFVKGYDSNGQLIGQTLTAHFAGMDSKNIKNPEKLKLSTKSLTLNKGQSAKIKASVKMEKGKKQAMADSHVAALRYRSGNKNVATVDRKGNVTAVNTGTCSVYVYTKNGLAKEVAVTVN